MYVYPAKDILFTVNLKWCLNQVCDKTSPWCDLSHEFGSGLYHSQPVFSSVFGVGALQELMWRHVALRCDTQIV